MNTHVHPRSRRTLVLATIVAAATMGLAPPGAATEEYDHATTTVVGPSERPQTAAMSSASSDAIVFNGRGSYHSVGMSQHGAHKQAIDGRTAAQIVQTYYVGTSVAERPVDHDIRVGVVRDTPRIQVRPRGGSMVVRFADRARFENVPADSPWTVTVDKSGTCTTSEATEVRHTGGCPTFDPAAQIEVFQPSGSNWVSYGSYGRSAVVDVVPDQPSTTWVLDTVVQLPLEQYLYGLAEVPYSWSTAALQAQAIAGRSYAMHRMLTRGPTPDGGCSCHVWDSQRDQVYRGHERELTSRWTSWQAAVEATRGRVVVARPDQQGYDSRTNGVVQAFYSASSHGRTENKHEVFFPSTWDYMVSVKDGWSLTAPNNWWAEWSIPVDRSTIASKVGLSRVDTVEVTERRGSGSALTVAFRGGGSTVTLSADEVRWMFGLYSNGFGIGDEVWGDPPTDPTTPTMPTNLFSDDDGSVHEASIDWLANAGITSGCSKEDPTLFCPESPVKRGQMATFLAKALNLPPAPEQFSDVPDNHTHAASIGALAAAGITTGCSTEDPTLFCPESPVKRGQMATFLAKALNLPPAPEQFSDVPDNHTHAASIGALAAAGITTGCDRDDPTLFCPTTTVKRAQMATFLRNALS